MKSINVGIKNGRSILFPIGSTVSELRKRLAEYTQGHDVTQLDSNAGVMIASYGLIGLSDFCGVSEKWYQMSDNQKITEGMMLRIFPKNSDRFYWFFTCLDQGDPTPVS
ncbi:MAG: hypothetical protein AAB484_00415 [Patescibacteria group bacterium]